MKPAFLYPLSLLAALAVGPIACASSSATDEPSTSTSEGLGIGDAERNLAASYDGQLGPLKRLTLGGKHRNGHFKSKFVAEIQVPCGHAGNYDSWPVRPWNENSDQGWGFWCTEEVKGDYHADWSRIQLEPNDDSDVSRYARRFLDGRFSYELNGEFLGLHNDRVTVLLRREGQADGGDYSCDDNHDCDDEDLPTPWCAGDGKWKCKRHSCQFQCERPDDPPPPPPPPPQHPWFCSPERDNLCSFPARTPGIEETFPGGICDPNGDGGFDDADWVQGYYRYQEECGR